MKVILYRLIFGALLLLGLSLYLQGLTNGFVWDDEGQIVSNALIRHVSNIPQFFLGSTFDPGGRGQLTGIYFKPLLPVSFSLIYALFGSDPLFFHLVQLLLHIASSFLVFIIFHRFFSKVAAFILAILFLVHPLQVESVAYISAMQDTLFLFFGFCALVISLLKRGVFAWVVTGLFLLCSMLSKETGILFLSIILLYHFLFSKRHVVSYVITSVIVLFIYITLRFVIADIAVKNLAYIPISGATFFERILSMPKIFFYYISSFFFPKDLAIAQHWVIKSPTFIDFYINLFLIICFSLALFFLWRRVKQTNQEKAFLFFLAWLMLGIGFHLHLFPLSMTVADRWFYFPMIGLLGLLGIAGQYMYGRIHWGQLQKVAVTAFICLLFVTLMTRTIVRIADWKDNFTLYSHDIAITKNSFDLENGMGVEYFKKGDLSRAKTHFERSVALVPLPVNLTNLGIVYSKEGDMKSAKMHFEKALSIEGGSYVTYEALADLLLFQESASVAANFTQKAVKMFPYNSRLWMTRAMALHQLGKDEEAAQAAEKSVLLMSSQDFAQLRKELQLTTAE